VEAEAGEEGTNFSLPTSDTGSALEFSWQLQLSSMRQNKNRLCLFYAALLAQHYQQKLLVFDIK